MILDLARCMAPELVLITGATFVLLAGALAGDAGRSLGRRLALATTAVALALVLTAGPPETPRNLLEIQASGLSGCVRLIGLSVGLLILLVNGYGPTPEERCERLAMILYSLAGLLLTALADDLVLLFLAIELVSVPAYVLVAISRGDIRAQEAGVKYFFLGALSAALMAYGFSFLYGATGTTVLSAISLRPEATGVRIGLLLAFAGVAFKMAAVPFHLYVADVYEGASAAVAGMLGFLPKLAGLVAGIRLLMLLPGEGSGAVWVPPLPVFAMLWAVAAATMTIGNVLGLLEGNVKRILAWSGVAHAGTMLVALLVGPQTEGGPMRDGSWALMFYATVYGAANLGAFGVLELLEAGGRPAETLEDLAGLTRRHPWAGLALVVCVFSLMGMPPTAGFVGKLWVLAAAFSVGDGHPQRTAMLVLGVIAAINAAVAAAYYLRIVAACCLPPERAPLTLRSGTPGLRLGLVACGLLAVLPGLWPAGLLPWTRPDPLPGGWPTGKGIHAAIGSGEPEGKAHSAETGRQAVCPSHAAAAMPMSAGHANPAVELVFNPPCAFSPHGPGPR